MKHSIFVTSAVFCWVGAAVLLAQSPSTTPARPAPAQATTARAQSAAAVSDPAKYRAWVNQYLCRLPQQP